MNSGLLFANYACACKKPLFLRTVFQILFRISHSNGKKEIQKQMSQCLNPFSDFAFDYKSEIQTSQSNAPFVSQNNETTAILVYQTIPVGDEHFCHLKLSFVPINLHSWSPRDWKVLVPFGGAPFRNLEGLLHPIRARQIWEKIIVIAKWHNKEYLFTHNSAQIYIWIAPIISK